MKTFQNTQDIQETADRLKEISEHIAGLLDEARALVQCGDPLLQNRAESYWLAHMADCLDGGAVSMATTIREMETLAEGGDIDDGEDHHG